MTQTDYQMIMNLLVQIQKTTDEILVKLDDKVSRVEFEKRVSPLERIVYSMFGDKNANKK